VRLPTTPGAPAPAVEAHYQFLAWLARAIEKFPKSHRFALGDRVENTAFERAGGADRGDANLEPELLKLERQLRDGSYRPDATR
jgi:hypothetical protein